MKSAVGLSKQRIVERAKGEKAMRDLVSFFVLCEKISMKRVKRFSE